MLLVTSKSITLLKYVRPCFNGIAKNLRYSPVKAKPAKWELSPMEMKCLHIRTPKSKPNEMRLELRKLLKLAALETSDESVERKFDAVCK